MRYKKIWCSFLDSVIKCNMGDSRQNYSNDLLVCRMGRKARVPIKVRKLSVGYDLTCIDSIKLAPFARGVFSTDLAFKIPHNLYAKIESRPTIWITYGVDVGGGVIDSDYVGPINLLLRNNTNKNVHIPEDTPVAQLILCERSECEVKEVSNEEFWEGVHAGKNEDGCGFGSTGFSGLDYNPSNVSSFIDRDEGVDVCTLDPSSYVCSCDDMNDMSSNQEDMQQFLENRRKMLDPSVLIPDNCEMPSTSFSSSSLDDIVRSLMGETEGVELNEWRNKCAFEQLRRLVYRRGSYSF